MMDVSDGIAGDVGGILGTFHGMTAPGDPASARVDKAVQSWVDGTSTNLGFGIRADRGTRRNRTRSRDTALAVEKQSQ